MDRPRPPSVERVLAAARAGAGTRDVEAVVAAAREVVDGERARLADGQAPRSIAALGAAVVATLEGFDGPAGAGDGEGRGGGSAAGPTRVFNATGVIIHTNLGRAAWPRAAIEAARLASEGAILLELERATGRRGARFRAAEAHLIALTGAEDALVVTNNAAAIALAVGLAGRGGGVAVSRGELVEIGGGVRIPEILRRAGVRLVEVGTTNRTRAGDFEAAFDDPRARIRAVLRVHPSNFVQAGFVEAPDPSALAEAAHRRGVIVLDDLGSGALLPTERVGLVHEPMPSERLAAGADVVTFSGDKLVGGPQAGLIAGRGDLVARLRRDPLARAMRPDKTILAAVAATLALYRAGRATTEIPVWRMLATPMAELRARAATIVGALPGGAAEVVELSSTVGGGSLPGEALPSVGLGLPVPNGRAATDLLARLRAGDPCVIARIERDRVILDLRTVAPGDDSRLAAAVARAIAPTSAP
ncbi:MAG TPA: L-seryl-tRNA(Sec) selenium transferase [Candidatus Sulfomarinibacteraceae bacterium]|nr:L-seryl-tRNA(Sec) selenium transferase [Candidatus Sulfomarinibacteraceae bacterium]